MQKHKKMPQNISFTKRKIELFFSEALCEQKKEHIHSSFIWVNVKLLIIAQDLFPA